MKCVLATAALLLLTTVTAAAQTDGCAPTAAGPSATVFFQRVSDACPVNAFPRDIDVPQLVSSAGQAPDGYVIAADLTRDDGVELLVLVSPWSLDNDVLGLAMARLVIDRGLGDGHTWRWTSA